MFTFDLFLLMPKPRMIILWSFSILIIAGVLFVSVFLLFLTVTYYRPPVIEFLPVMGQTPGPIPEKEEFTFLSWNIGYAGLGKEMDFFYEGGAMVRPTGEQFQHYHHGILEEIKKQDSVDFIFIQEADRYSKRSYYTDEVADLSHVLKSYCYSFAKNYDSRFVPIPPLEPMGRVVSGIVTFSRYTPLTAERIDFNTKFSWPKRLFFLKRCFIVLRYPMRNRRELVIINTHNSVFDKGGKLRKVEIEKLHRFMTAEFEKGNYVIAGGDWNQNPLNFTPGRIISGDKVKKINPPIDPDYFRGWQFAFDPEQPTNRDVDAFYEKGRTLTTIIDFFIVSPNIDIRSVKTLFTGFEYSDHQPLILTIKLADEDKSKN